ncbi:MAG: DUF1330 domain-containing protein [Rhizobiales bacterium]|nr:DUF1330 domain-containing protein [Hyphomicrobiales bacterium]
MPAYLVALRKVTDAEKMKRHIAKIVPMLESYGARYLTGTEGHHVLSGLFHPDRVVIVEFPDMLTLRKWYDSPAYRPLDELRKECGEEILLAVEGKAAK